jgi:hypothetical protein
MQPLNEQTPEVRVTAVLLWPARIAFVFALALTLAIAFVP